MKRILALFAVASLALPVQAQFNPVAPTVPDTTIFDNALLVQDAFVSEGHGHFPDNSRLSGFFVSGVNFGADTGRFRVGAFGQFDIPVENVGVSHLTELGPAYNLRKLIQIYIDSNTDTGHVVIEFLDFVDPNERLETWNDFVMNASLILGKDTLLFRNGISRFQDGHNDGSEYIKECGYYAHGNVVCWPDRKAALKTDEIVPILINAPPLYFLSPPSGELRVWQQKHNNARPVAGAVWVSWRISILDPINNIPEQLRKEKQWGTHYEYQLLRDGDKNWHIMELENTLLDEIEEVRTLSGIIHFQRRKYLVRGLDSSSEYSFCVRANNNRGPTEEICNLDIIRPVSSESAELPASVSLAQNYPNPFNPSTAIRYELPAAEHVRLDVFDVSGRNVKVLVDGTRPAGTHTARFDAGGLPSGLYVYRLQAGGNTIVKTMHLIR